MPPVKTEALPHNAGFLVSEAPGALSRDQVTFVTDAAIIKAGTVVGRRDDGNWQRLQTTSSEGNNAARGLVLNDVDATGGAAKGVVIERLAEVRDADLIWPDGISSPNKATAITQLDARNIKVRAIATVVSTQST